MNNLKMGYADLYYNDVHVLELTLREIKMMYRRRKDVELIKNRVNKSVMNRKCVNHF